LAVFFLAEFLRCWELGEVLPTELGGADRVTAHPRAPRVTNWAAAQQQVSRFFFSFLFVFCCLFSFLKDIFFKNLNIFQILIFFKLRRNHFLKI
jgi:hypothetical protein